MKLFTKVLLMAFLPALLFAQDISKTAVNPSASDLFINIEDIEPAQKMIKSDGLNAFISSEIFTSFTALGNGAGNTTPFYYEPNSGMLAVVSYNAINYGEFVADSLFLHYSMDDGATWTKEAIFDMEDVITGSPSISINNPDGSNNLSDMYWLVMASYAEYDDQIQRSEDKGAYLIINNPKADKIEELPYESPDESTSAPNQLWTNTQTAAYFDEEDSTSYHFNYGYLTPSDEIYQYGYYGLLALTIPETGDLDIPVSKSPSAWSIENFLPGPRVSSTYNSAINMDYDQNGNLYSFVTNYLPGDSPETTMRKLMFSKSTDHGQTWSSFSENQLPTTILNNYLSSQGGLSDRNPFQSSFSSQDIAVWGEDQFSIITRFAVYEDTDDQIDIYQLVEIRYDEGNWSINRIRNTEIPYYPEIFGINDNGTVRDSIRLIPRFRGIESQMSLTEDGQYLLAKWIESNEDYPHSFPGFRLLGNNLDLDDFTFYSTDVMMAYKHIHADSVWHVNNVTDDEQFDKNSWIPSRIPSIREVPLMTSRTMPIPSERLRSGYPSFLQNLVWAIFPLNAEGESAGGNQQFYYQMVNAENPNSVTEQPKYDLNVHEVYPNPASDHAELTFNLDVPSNVRIDIFNQLGSKVANVMDQAVNAGIHGKTINTSNLAPGIYLVNFTINGQTLTKKLNVVR
ncbi:MAG: T9SS type A sorting domain-containing protein [Candidatus Kapaibacterium sp.]